LPIDDQRGWALLRRLDDRVHPEFPPGYDEAATRARFHRLVARLNEKGCTCGVDRIVQDASHYGTITISPAATACGQRVTVTISFAPPRYFATWWIRFFDYL
jgi:cytosine/adenosine deaminase-related metal-dependent hydrolase